jgi:hypothetical protein
MEPLTPRQSASLSLSRAPSLDVYLKDQKMVEVMPITRSSHTGNLDYINFTNPQSIRYYPINGGYSPFMTEKIDFYNLLREAPSVRSCGEANAFGVQKMDIDKDVVKEQPNKRHRTN